MLLEDGSGIAATLHPGYVQGAHTTVASSALMQFELIKADYAKGNAALPILRIDRRLPG